MSLVNAIPSPFNNSSSSMYPPIQYWLVGTLFLIAAIVMAVSSFIGHTHSKLDILVIVFSVVSFFIACDQYRRAFVSWQATRKKLASVESTASA